MVEDVGTLLYQAPEILKREEYDSRADIWSLGCVIFMMCNNDTPFYAHSESKLI